MMTATPPRSASALIVLAGMLTALPVFAQDYNEITGVSPASGAQGTAGLAITFTLDTDLPPAPPAGVPPDSVTLGGIAGYAVSHPDAYSITALFDIPSGASTGATDIAITFTTPNGILIFQTPAGFTIIGSGGTTNTAPEPAAGGIGTYPMVDTGQTASYNESSAIAAPNPGQAFAGQDGQYTGNTMQYSISGDGLSVFDHRTGLTWTRSPDLNGDGTINASDKLTQAAAVAYAATLNATNFGGFGDWRLPSIKELYSLMNFSGVDISGPNPTSFVPFIDIAYFAFGYGDTNAGDRLIDAQFATTTIYVDTVMNGQQAMFGLNLADGRIKGYPVSGKSYYAYFCRGSTNYGLNAFVDNGDGTVIDLATGLQWQQADSGAGLMWEDALAYAENLDLGGYRDWRLPDAKELQSILDYTRSPGTTGSAAIDPRFSCTAITNEAGAPDFPWYWSSTTHLTISPTEPAAGAVYVCFGRGLGYMNGSWMDVHGAGCQRSDAKGGSLSDWTYTPHGYYSSQAPQGDAVRLFNFVRAVRGGKSGPDIDTDADGITDWDEYSYATNITAMAADGDLDGDGVMNADELRAGTSPADPLSHLAIDAVTQGDEGLVVAWNSVVGKRYRIETMPVSGIPASYTTLADSVDAEPPANRRAFSSLTNEAAFVRVTVAE